MAQYFLLSSEIRILSIRKMVMMSDEEIYEIFGLIPMVSLFVITVVQFTHTTLKQDNNIDVKIVFILTL